MITDYSSVFFDFSYMSKPVIFYQFDEKEFREKQYAEGYFDYHHTVLGDFAATEKETLDLLETQLQGGILLKGEALTRSFFPLWDSNNNERIYEEIKKN